MAREIGDHQGSLVCQEVKETMVVPVREENLAEEENQELQVAPEHQDRGETKETVEKTAPLVPLGREEVMVLLEKKEMLDSKDELVSQELVVSQGLLEDQGREEPRESEVETVRTQSDCPEAKVLLDCLEEMVERFA